LLESGLDLLGARGFAGVGEDGEGLYGEVLALAAVGVPVTLSEFRAFHDCAGAERGGEGIHVVVGEGVVVRKGNSEAAQGAWFGAANGAAGSFADAVEREVFVLAESDDEEAFRADSLRSMEQQ